MWPPYLPLTSYGFDSVNGRLLTLAEASLEDFKNIENLIQLKWKVLARMSYDIGDRKVFEHLTHF